ncbi:acetylornithine deacetylase [Tissierella praeacuta DSM 18095]|uniref:Acetylornithine deacetylase n=1 Tax=Tissierella praeacuta DSM 18095 TaxID=1123404 RepID=A0A1M4S7S1_9FIRM|nr:ArgE/DapE family deacylase [Tissierella praeacuta]SHE28228.1 acetylornithine deacetylase [Tissierella praeacuta DSM 18095]SUP01065.1 N-formyl-4-amino-5-aminomethyl-2-methylpyrimidinedeformylase [Tissierella praeacuta]
MIEQLKIALEENKNKYISRLADLVAIDTRDIGHGIDGGLEKEGQDYLINMFNNMGATVVKDQVTEEVIQKSIKEFKEGNPGHNYDNRYNVYATFKGNGGKSIMFNGHVDTMPPGDINMWDTPPHEPTIKNGKMYGLGVCDMKGGLVASAMAVELLKDAGISLPGDVIITSVIDEEGGGNGSIAAAMNGQKADAVVVCEPTNYELIAAHMGFIFFKVEIEGLAVHSGSKWLGVSAIEKAIKLMAAIDELEHRWLMKYKHTLLPAPTSNVGVIEGGTAGSTVADYCSFSTCVHYLPEMNHDEVVKEYTNAIYRCCEGDEWLKDHKPNISIYQAGGSFEMNLDHLFVDSFKRSFERATGKELKIVGSPAGCDSRIWKNIAGAPTLQYGPGRQAQCHAVNEYIELEQYLDSILIYAQLIIDWCNR